MKELKLIYSNKCKRCKHTWKSSTNKPSRCGVCKSRYWNKPYEHSSGKLKKKWCLRCNKSWNSKINPIKCPYCQNINWNKLFISKDILDYKNKMKINKNPKLKEAKRYYKEIMKIKLVFNMPNTRL